MSQSVEFAKRNIRRSPFQAVAASMVMFLAFFVLLTFTMLTFGSQLILRYYESKPQAIAFFKDGTTEADVNAIRSALIEEGRVTETKYVTKDEALSIYRQRNKNDPTLLELVTANILPASLEVSTESPEDLKPIAEILEREPVIEEVIVPEDVVESLTAATRIIRWVGLSVVTFLVIFASLVVLMVIGFKIRLRRDEIETMKLLGASSSFIRAPFILEGIFYGLIGATTAWVMVYILLWYFTPYLQGYLGEVNLLPVNPILMLALLGSALVLAFIVGGLGSISAVRRYLKL
jgi:cell division transport system permease protein